MEPQADGSLELRYPRECYHDQGGCGVPGFVEGFDFLNAHSIQEEVQIARLASNRGEGGISLLLKAEGIGRLSRGARVVVVGTVLQTGGPRGSAASAFALVVESISAAPVGVEKT